MYEYEVYESISRHVMSSKHIDYKTNRRYVKSIINNAGKHNENTAASNFFFFHWLLLLLLIGITTVFWPIRENRNRVSRDRLYIHIYASIDIELREIKPLIHDVQKKKKKSPNKICFATAQSLTRTRGVYCNRTNKILIVQKNNVTWIRENNDTQRTLS